MRSRRSGATVFLFSSYHIERRVATAKKTRRQTEKNVVSAFYNFFSYAVYTAPVVYRIEGRRINSDLSGCLHPVNQNLLRAEFGVRRAEIRKSALRLFIIKKQYSEFKELFKELWKFQMITCYYAQDKEFCFL